MDVYHASKGHEASLHCAQQLSELLKRRRDGVSPPANGSPPNGSPTSGSPANVLGHILEAIRHKHQMTELQTRVVVSRLPAAPVFPDEVTTSCMNCTAPFGLAKSPTNFRVHCGRCGGHMCPSCCWRQAKVRGTGRSTTVCERCFEHLKAARAAAYHEALGLSAEAVSPFDARCVRAVPRRGCCPPAVPPVFLRPDRLLAPPD